MTNSEAHKPERIMLVDDEPLVLEFLEDLLTARGFDVLKATGGEAALRLARTRCPDYVLSDTNMPGMDGVELLAAFRADPDLSAVPFFLMSGNPEEEARGLAAGAAGFFHKPIANADLLARVIRGGSTAGAEEHTPEKVLVASIGGSGAVYLTISRPSGTAQSSPSSTGSDAR